MTNPIPLFFKVFRYVAFVVALFVTLAQESSSFALDGAAQSELIWRAGQFRDAVRSFEQSAAREHVITEDPGARAAVTRLGSACEDLLLVAKANESTVTTVGKNVDKIIRETANVGKWAPSGQTLPNSVRTEWRRVLDALDALQGQYSSIQERIGNQVQSPSTAERRPNGTTTIDSDFDRIARLLEKVEQLAPQVLRRPEDQRLIGYLRERVIFVRDHSAPFGTRSELYQREMKRLGEDGSLVRAMLQRNPYDEALGTAWREARDLLEKMVQRANLKEDVSL